MTDPVDVARIGNLTDHPELRHGQSGKAFTSFGLAYRPNAPKGEPEPETTFYEVVLRVSRRARRRVAAERRPCRCRGQGRGRDVDREGWRRTTQEGDPGRWCRARPSIRQGRGEPPTACTAGYGRGAVLTARAPGSRDRVAQSRAGVPVSNAGCVTSSESLETYRQNLRPTTRQSGDVVT